MLYNCKYIDLFKVSLDIAIIQWFIIYYTYVVYINSRIQGGENMAKIDVSDLKALEAAAVKYLGDFPGDLICALQFWYEGLDGQGVPNKAEMAALQNTIANAPGWADVGVVRYEKYGMQKSYKRA